MKASLSWLNQYVSIDMDASDLADALTMAGLEVDSVTDRYDYLNTVRVGRNVGRTKLRFLDDQMGNPRLNLMGIKMER